MTFFLRNRQRRQSFPVARGDVGALRHERCDRVQIVVRGGQVQRPPAGGVGGVHVGAVADEQSRDQLVIAHQRRVQRRVAVRVA